MSTRIVNLRLEKEILEDLNLLAEWNQHDRTSMIKKLLRQAIVESKIDHAINLYKDGKSSIEEAAEIAIIDLWSFHDELIRNGITHPSEPEDLRQDLSTLRKLKLY